MLSLVEMIGAVWGADLSKRCETCHRQLGRHDDGELLYCISMYAGRVIGQRLGAGVRAAAHRQVGRVQRASRRRK